MDITAGRPGPSVQEVLAADINPAPKVMLSESPTADESDADLSIERYFSREWHQREVENIWRKCWQLACRVEEIPNVGDHVVYDIVHDSLVVMRTGPDEIRAFVNSSLHRGTMRRTRASRRHRRRHGNAAAVAPPIRRSASSGAVRPRPDRRHPHEGDIYAVKDD